MKWQLITDIDEVEDFSLEDIKTRLESIKNEEAEYMIIKPSEMVGNCNFMQLMLDDENLFHLEISMKFEYGSGSILSSKDGITHDEAVEIFENFIESSQAPDVEEWEVVGRFE